MSGKTLSVRLFLIVVFIIAIPVVISAAGNRESGNSTGITLDNEIMKLLEGIESGQIGLQAAKENLLKLEKEYRISSEERKKITQMLDEVAAGQKTAEDCQDQLKEQLRTRERTQEQIMDQIKSCDETKDQQKSSSTN